MRKHARTPLFYSFLMGLVLLLHCVWAYPALAAGTADSLNQLEQQIFARTYSQESTTDRIVRLEKTIFGAEQNGQTEGSRIQALAGFLKSSPSPNSVPLTKSPQPQTTSTSTTSLPPSLPNESNYPAVTAMEQKVFGRSYASDPLETRITKLEEHTLGHTQQGTFQERTDQLRLVILGDTATVAESDDPTDAPPDASQPLPASDNPDQTAEASADLLQALPAVEKRVLGRTYPEDAVQNRLNRLEARLFKSTAPEMSLDDRFYRIAGVVNAQRSPNRDQAYYNGGPYSRPPAGGAALGGWGSMLLMILMSLL